jgi:hypothetical protein
MTPRRKRPERQTLRSPKAESCDGAPATDAPTRGTPPKHLTPQPMSEQLIDQPSYVRRQDLANPHRHQPLRERLIAANAIDLRDNHRVIDFGDGYAQVVPIDSTKRFRAK